ncbi:2-phosphosulfolactate phosphatase [Azospira restricta]|uniref:Probable 2-phosphosulfolactate phosphatase n=1 Tax=Azospira restricta TaxID=404405 RepID=A0A974Y4D8_9RHOO|nr:2-phosphosulfolactate phosphatase [Azospira restricta]QRJ64356.1 2-phosphosulfolactate phosphatase [Azospira restricta]
MRTRRLYLNRLDPSPGHADDGVVVVIDVLRSFSTAAYAFAAGARAIHPVETVAEALALHRLLPEALTTGAVAGGDPVPGFDYGNSPSRLAGADLRGKELIQTTAAGVRGLLRFAHARAAYAGSLVCAAATAAAIRRQAPEQVTLLVTGEWVDRDGDEDAACADYLEALLHGETPDPRPFEQRVRDSDFGRRFAAGNNPSLPPADLELCAQADRFDFAMPVVRRGERLVLLPAAP